MQALRNNVLLLTFLTLIPGEAWATPLFDRNAMQLRGKQSNGSRVTCIGDACHPMSMFKGQGANQVWREGTWIDSLSLRLFILVLLLCCLVFACDAYHPMSIIKGQGANQVWR
jgi:2-polyprenyl-6-methoxyphenol hydroxylase-like FAD-dependent oxidoreductase